MPRLLHAAARERLKVATTDLFLPAHLRLTDWQRTLMTSLLDRLVQTVEQDLLAGVARHLKDPDRPDLTVLLGVDPLPISPPLLRESGTLHDVSLVTLLLRRTEEHRLHRAAHAAPAAPDGLLSELVHDAEEEIADAAMAVLIAHSRRFDAFQEPILPLHELPAEVTNRLVWSVAAAVRSYFMDRQLVSPDEADDALAAAANRCLSGHDISDSFETRCLKLVRLIEERGGLNEGFIARALPEGGLSLFLVALSLRCGLLPDAVWELASEPLGRGLPLLLRAAGLDRNTAGEILVAIGSNSATDADVHLIRQLDIFDASSAEDAQRTLRPWRADPLYRAAAESSAS